MFGGHGAQENTNIVTKYIYSYSFVTKNVLSRVIWLFSVNNVTTFKNDACNVQNSGYFIHDLIF